MKKRQIACSEEFHIIFVDTLPSTRGSTTPHSLGVSAHRDFLPKSTVCEGGKSNVTVKKPQQILPQPGDRGQRQQR